jgi:hypothetical protein
MNITAIVALKTVAINSSSSSIIKACATITITITITTATTTKSIQGCFLLRINKYCIDCICYTCHVTQTHSKCFNKAPSGKIWMLEQFSVQGKLQKLYYNVLDCDFL